MEKKKPLEISKPLEKLFKVNGEIFLDGVRMIFDKMSMDQKDNIKDQTNAYKAFSKNFESVSKNITNVTSRKEAIQANKQLERLYLNISKSNELTYDELASLQSMHDELAGVSKTLVKNQHSMAKTLSTSFKSNLPSIAGVLGALGLNNPAFMFLGNMVQDTINQRRAIAEKEQDLANEHQAEIIRTELEGQEAAAAEKESKPEKASKKSTAIEGKQDSANKTADILASHSGKLDYIGSLLDVIVGDTQSSKFADIERERERIRREEALIDAVKEQGEAGTLGADIAPAEEKKTAASLTGFLESAANIRIMLLGAIPLITGVISGITAFALPVIGTLALAYTAYKGFMGAFEGWGKAAEKLGKEQATLSDKVASAAGGFIGGTFSLFDSILGFFGIETQIGPVVDMFMTKSLAGVFDFFKGLWSNIESLFNTVKDFFSSIKNNFDAWVEEKLQLLIDFGNEKFNGLATKVIDFFTKLGDVFFPDGFSLKEVILVPLRAMKLWVEALFNFELPEIPSVEKMLTEGMKKMTDIFQELIDSLVNKARGIFSWGKEKIVGKEATATEPAKEGLLTKIKNKAIDVKDAITSPRYMGSKDSAPPTKDAKENMERVRKTLKETGNYTDDQITGILANLQRESKFDPKAVGDSGAAYGIAQWHPDRQAKFEKAFGKSMKGSSVEDQARFIDWELQNTEKKAGQKLENAESPRSAARAFSKFYERPADKEGEAARRANLADKMSMSATDEDKIAEVQPRANLNAQAVTTVQKDAVDKEKASSASANIVNAPSSTKVVNSSNNNTYQTGASPYETDATWASFQSQLGY